MTIALAIVCCHYGRRTAEPRGADMPLCHRCWHAVWPERNSP